MESENKALVVNNDTQIFKESRKACQLVLNLCPQVAPWATEEDIEEFTRKKPP